MWSWSMLSRTALSKGKQAKPEMQIWGNRRALPQHKGSLHGAIRTGLTQVQTSGLPSEGSENAGETSHSASVPPSALPSSVYSQGFLQLLGNCTTQARNCHNSFLPKCLSSPALPSSLMALAQMKTASSLGHTRTAVFQLSYVRKPTLHSPTSFLPTMRKFPSNHSSRQSETHCNSAPLLCMEASSLINQTQCLTATTHRNNAE